MNNFNACNKDISIHPTALAVYLLLIALVFLFFSYLKVSFVLIAVAITYLLLAGCGILTALLLKPLQSEYTTPATLTDKKRVAIILLGCSTIKWPNSMIKATFFSYSRLFEALRLHQLCKMNNCEFKIIISGGDAHTPGTSEAEVYRDELVGVGVDANNIQLESASRNTYENAQFVCDILTNSEPYDQIFLISSPIFLKRALLYFSHFGFSPVPCPADYISAWILFKPAGYNLFLCDFLIKEYISIYYYFWLCRK